jgi:Spy/CpxP family protein refolding chaperone
MHGDLARVLVAWLVTCVVAAQAQNPRPAQPNPLALSLDWLTGEKMLKELEILPDQQEKLRALRGELKAKTKEAYEAIDATGIPKDDRKVLREQAKAEVGGEVAREIEQVLLPHQIKRLRQIVLQRRLGQHTFGGSAAAALGSEDLANELGITDKQREELKTKEKELKEELERKAKELLRQLKDESQEELFEILTPTQRQRLKEMLGERFEWE